MLTVDKLNAIIKWANKKKLRLQELYNIEITRLYYRWYDITYYWWEYLIDTEKYQYKKEWVRWWTNDYLSERWERLN